MSNGVARIVLVLLLAPFLLSYVAPASPANSQRPRRAPVRPVRVLVASNVSRIGISADSSLSVSADTGLSLILDAEDDDLVISQGPKGRLLVDDQPCTAARLLARAEPPSPVVLSVHDGDGWSDGVRYPGQLSVVVRDDGRLDVINLVDVETYVGCVVAGEVWPTFHTEAYRAQAIASRTFVLFQMIQRNEAPFDVTATQNSQVYRGIRTDKPGRRGAEAAEYTRGIVLTWRDNGTDRLFCTFYSAACGGLSQSAAIFGPSNDIPPLAGNVRCDYCKIAPGKTYRWGPVRLKKSELRDRLVSSYPDLASLGHIQSVTVTERTSTGRPMTLRITGSGGDSYDMLAERFRLAIGGSLIRSTDFKLRNTKRELIFEDGRGFGHGLGLCQWGMQGQALEGKHSAAILRYYYPGAQLMRAY